jgi:hypothetical protein
VELYYDFCFGIIGLLGGRRYLAYYMHTKCCKTFHIQFDIVVSIENFEGFFFAKNDVCYVR